MCESQAFECQVADLAVGIFPLNADQGVQVGSNYHSGVHVFSVVRLVVKGVVSLVEIPLARGIDKLVSVL